MNEQLKFLLQTLLAPIAIALTGFIINSNLQEKERNFQKLKLTQEILNSAFNGGNVYQAMALAQLLPQVVDDRPFADSAAKLINAFYYRQAESAAKSGNDSLFNLIETAALTFNTHSNSVANSIKNNPVTNKAQQAINYEQKGFEFLQQGKPKEAEKFFRKADSVYPAFHSAYEIAEAIKKESGNSHVSNDSVSKKVLEKVRINYSWKVPPQYLK